MEERQNFKWRPSITQLSHENDKKKQKLSLSVSSDKGLFPSKSSVPPNGEKTQPRIRMRAAKACKRCRNMKIKCSGQHPCTNCVKHNLDCIFTNDNLPHKMDASMHLRLSDLINSINSGSSLSIDGRDVHKEYLCKVIRSSTDYVIPLSSSTIGPDLHRHQNVLASEFFGTVLESLPEEKRASIVVPPPRYFGWNMLLANSSYTETFPSPPNLELDQKKYVDYFFSEVNSLYGVIHESVFRDQLNAYNELDGVDANETTESFSRIKIFRATIFLMYALSIRLMEYSSQPPSTSVLNNEKLAFKYAYEITNLCSFEQESFDLIQAWLLITIYLRITHHQGSVYMALNRATSMAKLMGLRYEDPILLAPSPYEKLRAKRIFWAVFTIERLFGLHKGNYGAVSIKYIQRDFPSLNYGLEEDTWLPLPAFALLHVARIANMVYTSNETEKYDKIEVACDELYPWLQRNGFATDHLFNNISNFSGLAASQVMLHYHDVIMCVHGKVLFNFLANQDIKEGPSLERNIMACNGIIEVLQKVYLSNLLYVPWYNTLLLLFNVGISSLTLLNAGIYIDQSKNILQVCTRLLTALQEAPIANISHGKGAHHEKVNECLWVLLLAKRALALRFEHNWSQLQDIQAEEQLIISYSDPTNDVLDDEAKSFDQNYTELPPEFASDDKWLAQWMDFRSSPLQDNIMDNDIEDHLWVTQWMNFHSPAKEFTWSDDPLT